MSEQLAPTEAEQAKAIRAFVLRPDGSPRAHFYLALILDDGSGYTFSVPIPPYLETRTVEALAKLITDHGGKG